MNKNLVLISVTLIAIIFNSSQPIFAKDKNNKLMSSENLSGLKFRNVGPAFMSGRIADIEIDPNNRNIWYVGVGSGGVWKTVNAGTTWTPLFDEQAVYSIGTVTVDPNNSSTIWVGSGENVSGRHVGFGDGVYVSYDGGTSWQNKGLKQSEHISEIIVHPKNPDIIWVAAQGPLWSKGGQRGLFKSIDGGDNWKLVLGDNQWVGVTDLLIDPREPNRLYAATWQRHRTVAAVMDGGPGTGIYRSEDGGDNWLRLDNKASDQKENKALAKKSGLPKSEMGKIGLAISPINPDVVYAAIELDRRKGAVYRSDNRGATWEKRSDTVAGGTGPHYYQELYASPHNFDQIFLANVRMLQSNDGGTTFAAMEEEHKHGDNHSLTFLQSDKNYMLMGSDGGIYESFDLGANWRFVSNLPITQFYKLAVDDAVPFYNIYGGTQDNSTQGGPSRTDNRQGIRNSDWELVLGGDGHQPATEPGNPDIVYAQSQQGNLVRADRTTGEVVFIQPQPALGEPEERFNWDAPILVSPHKNTRIYHASQRVWQSDDRGDSWRAISPDLSRNLERIEQPIMDGKPGWDSAWDMWAMSQYSTITSLAESPMQSGLIYAGTDDGLIQVTENGGENWRKIAVGKLPGVPDSAFINDIKADLFDADTVYIALDNHKFGDYKPYLLKSTNRGKSWSSISGDLPDKHLVWRLVQDHIKPELMFAATELGLFFTVNGGKNWVELNGGVPTISFRDLAIQQRENDLVAASFGRGFFVLDDYSALRSISEQALAKEALLFPTRKAWWYIQRGPVSRFSPKGSQGASFYTAENPPFGAVFTYYLKDSFKTKEEIRQENEKALKEKNRPVPFPGWDKVEEERRQQPAKIWITIKDATGNVIRRVSGSNDKGFNRVDWNLSLPNIDVITVKKPEEQDSNINFMVAPGEYSVTLSKQLDGKVTVLQGPQNFTVEALTTGTLKGASPDEVVSFWQAINQVKRDANGVYQQTKKSIERVEMLERALLESTAEPGSLDFELAQIRAELLDINHQLNGDQSKTQVYLSNVKTVENLLDVAEFGTVLSTYGPTPTHQQSLDLAKQKLQLQQSKLKALTEKRIPELESNLRAMGAPWVTGQLLP
ncbi:MAG: photosystem II stability/assembly factor-like uncharacterized protein [Paraglaciecola sp.]|jgi:photosystem II stability/assembly factor-like uncharacterized protein